MTSVPEIRPLGNYEGDELDVDPLFTELQREAPVAHVLLDGRPVWVVTGYHEARTVFADPRFSRARAFGNPAALVRTERHLIDMDPPEHDRLRDQLNRWFTARRAKGLRPRAEAITAGLLDDLAARPQPADLVHGLALPLPFTIICELLGVPPGDRVRFSRWAEVFVSVSGHSPGEIAEGKHGIESYLLTMIGRARTDPGDHLLGALVRASDDDGVLSEEEILRLATGVLVGGYDTTATQITNFAYTLLSRPALWSRLVERPHELPGVIEELLRILPLGAGTHLGNPRVTTEDVELGGRRIPAGAVVFASRSAANRDPAVYPDPEEIVLAREGLMPHLAFGHGLHHCVGAQLARMELQVALGGLLGRFPGLRLGAAPDELPWKKGLLVAGPRRLPVVCAPERAAPETR